MTKRVLSLAVMLSFVGVGRPESDTRRISRSRSSTSRVTAAPTTSAVEARPAASSSRAAPT